MSRRYIIILLLLMFSYPLLVAQNSQQAATRERIYLQTDKNEYLAGELLWLKVLTTSADGKPQTFSKIAYIELLDGTVSHLQIKVNVENAVGEASVVLPASLPTGYYRLVAYTRYMRNEDINVLFEKNITVINTSATNSGKSDTGSPSSTQVKSTELSSNGTIKLLSDKITYSQRDRVKLSLENLPKDIYTLSVSVAGRNITPTEGNTDMVQWQKALSSSSSAVLRNDYLPEYEGHIVTGKLMDIATNKPKYDSDVTPFISFGSDKIRLFTGKMDKDANIQFFTKRIDGMKELVATTLNYSSSKYRIDIQPPFIVTHQKKQLPILSVDSVYAGRLLNRSVALQAMYTFLTDSLSLFQIEDSYFAIPPYKSYLLDEYTRFVTMPEVITEFVTFVRFRTIYGKRFLSVFREGIGYSQGNTLALLDGIPVFDHDIIYNYNPLYVKRLDVYQGRYVFGGQIFDGILSFTTYKNDYPELELDNTTQFFDYAGTVPRRTFYEPAYDTNSRKNSRLPDFRHTLYWNPQVDTKGNTSVTIPFYTSDLPGEYNVTVEGITADGRVVYATSAFTVE